MCVYHRLRGSDSLWLGYHLALIVMICAAISINCRRVTDGHTDTDHSMHRASVAMRGKKASAWWLTSLKRYGCFQLNLPVFLRLRTTETSKKPKAPSTSATLSNAIQVERFFRQSRMLLRHCCLFGNNVAGFGNNVERNFVFLTKLKQTEHVQFVSI